MTPIKGVIVMQTEDRRNKIYSLLEASYPKTVTAAFMAKQFNVSRQIIVGDISVLKASGKNIISTARGYVAMRHPYEVYDYVGTLSCKHDNSLLAEELYSIVELGGIVIDVIILHDLYGKISCRLDLSSKYDVEKFLENSSLCESGLLCSLTDGQHIHTIGCKSEADFYAIKNALLEKHIVSKL